MVAADEIMVSQEKKIVTTVRMFPQEQSSVVVTP
jgi:hypothetical protein